MKTLVIDPGHGGHDPGAVGAGGLEEKAVVLAVCRAMRDMLHGAVRVVLTRTGDDFVELRDRSRMANVAPADLFVSVHANAGGGRGYECYHFPGSEAGAEAAEELLDAFAREWPERRNRGRKERGFSVLRHTGAPAVLFELEFIDHAAGEAWLDDPENQERCAAALVEGVLRYWGLETEEEPDVVLAPEPPAPPELSGDDRDRLEVAWELIGKVLGKS